MYVTRFVVSRSDQYKFYNPVFGHRFYAFFGWRCSTSPARGLLYIVTLQTPVVFLKICSCVSFTYIDTGIAMATYAFQWYQPLYLVSESNSFRETFNEAMLTNQNSSLLTRCFFSSKTTLNTPCSFFKKSRTTAARSLSSSLYTCSFDINPVPTAWT